MPPADFDAFYRALAARDARFDGVFFVGVATTGIYCRPVCTVRLPRRDRCAFFASAAAAEAAGFRPCLRCRPELAPGMASVDAVQRLARGALGLIEEGALDEGASIAALALRLGVSDRHLRRATQTVFGASPVALAQTHRLLTAKRLLTETRLPVIAVAYTSGFRSLRRFNALFRERYRMPPSRLRIAKAGRGREDALRLALSCRMPFAWEAILSYLAGRAIPGVERVDAQGYARTIAMGPHEGWFRVSRAPGGVAVELPHSLLPVLPAVLSRVRRLFDLDAAPAAIHEHLSMHPLLRPRVAAQPGLRVPGSAQPFETAVRTLVGQQVSVKAASTVMARITRAIAKPYESGIEGLSLRPLTPEDVASRSADELAPLGLPGKRAEAILELARALCSGRVSLGPSPDPERQIALWRALPGIGPWTSQYFAMRILRWPDAFPAGDLGVRQALGGAGEKEAERLSQAWRPWRAYATLYLWQGAPGA